MAVPLHRHEISLDYRRVELEVQYTVRPDWDLIARIPWEEKAQSAAITLVDPADEQQLAAMLRNMNLHHRSETYGGMSDLMLLGRRRFSHGTRDLLTLALGATAPIGRTEENPYLLGDLGIEHLHIQFGTGTVDPLLEGSYQRLVHARLSAGGYLSTRLPLYENRRTFRAPPEVSGGVNALYHLNEKVHLRAEAGAYYQGYGYWDGLRDENTGLVATTAALGATFRWGDFAVGVDLRVPLSQRTLSEGDAFELGPMVVLNLSGLLHRTTRAQPQDGVAVPIPENR